MILVSGDASWDLLFEIDQFPGPDEKVFTDSMFSDVGGVGANAAIAARLLGAEVVFMATFGGDAFAPAVQCRLAAAGVDLSLCRTDQDATTPIAIIMTDPSGEKRIVLAPSPGMSPAADQLPDGLSVGLDWVHMVAYDTSAAISIATRLSGQVPISLDLEPATFPNHDREEMKPLIELLDTVIVNTHACRLFGGPTDAIATLTDWGAENVILTLGADGAVFVARDERHEMAAPRVPVVDTTGAGDTFAAAYAVARTEGQPVARAVAFAVVAASLSCRGLGPRGRFPTRAEIESMMR